MTDPIARQIRRLRWVIGSLIVAIIGVWIGIAAAERSTAQAYIAPLINDARLVSVDYDRLDVAAALRDLSARAAIPIRIRRALLAVVRERGRAGVTLHLHNIPLSAVLDAVALQLHAVARDAEYDRGDDGIVFDAAAVLASEQDVVRVYDLRAAVHRRLNEARARLEDVNRSGATFQFPPDLDEELRAVDMGGTAAASAGLSSVCCSVFGGRLVVRTSEMRQQRFADAVRRLNNPDGQSCRNPTTSGSASDVR